MAINIPQMSDDMQRSEWFDKIAIWNLDGEQKSEIATTVIDDINTGVEYWSSMFLSAVIATLGLLINSTPVVIGAMLIAPIMQPIQAVAFATSTGNRKLFVRALGLLLLSTAGGIACAAIVASLIPFGQITNEIAIRTQPTLLDLFIASASGIVAFLAFGYQKLAKSLAGVAMAASLVPPLCVIGIGIAFGSRPIGRGSSVLFLTNLIAIIIAGIGIFFLFGFHPNAKGGFTTSLINSLSALVMLLLLCIPLASSLITITQDLVVKNNITTITNEFVQQIDARIDLQSMEYDHIKGGHAISLTLRVPQDQLASINNANKEQLTKYLSETLESNIELDITVVPVTSIYVEEIRQPTFEEQVTTTTTNFLNALYRTAFLLNLEYYQNDKNILVGTFYTEDNFDKQLFSDQYEEYILDAHPQVDIVIINRQTQAIEELPESLFQQTIQSLTTSFSSFFPQSTLHKLQLDQQDYERTIEIRVSTPSLQPQFDAQMYLRKIQLEQLYTQPIEIIAHTTYLETQSY